MHSCVYHFNVAAGEHGAPFQLFYVLLGDLIRPAGNSIRNTWFCKSVILYQAGKRSAVCQLNIGPVQSDRWSLAVPGRPFVGMLLQMWMKQED